jgi:alanine racemase
MSHPKHQIPNASEPHVSVLEIDLAAIDHNVGYFKKKLPSKTKLLAVVKAFSYGLDAIEISKHLEKQQIDYFAVAYTEEGVFLREAGVKTPILVLHAQPANYETLIANCLEPNLYSLLTLKLFSELATSKKLKNYPFHIKFNTGLNRLGMTYEDLPAILKHLENSSIKVASLFSHLAASEDPNEKEFSLRQIEKFKHCTAEILKFLPYKPLLHMSNTSGIVNFPEAHFDMVRLGIGMYGFGNDTKETAALQNVGRLKTLISQIHKLKKGETLGYNRAFIASEPTKTATLPIGHADGIHRSLGNGNGSVKINTQDCPIIGNVCMDMIMVDITNVKCKEGDEAIVFDSQQMVANLAEKSDTISYEIITGISQRIPRKIIS